MAHVFKISNFGIKLIKAYEGFRPVETTLVSGQRVIGYGHRFQDTEEPAISRKRAEDVLKADLEAYEDLVNENVFAPLSQSQFDALVSLSFNIGPQAFLSSSVLHALNNGRPLAAAAGFDEWRKSIIDGKTYVVDALVRRRTAEKSLFLRATEGVVTAPRNELPPKQDHGLQALAADADVFDNQAAHGDAGIVAHTPYAAKSTPARRREDGPAGIMGLSEIEAQQAKLDAAETPPRSTGFDPHKDGVDDIVDLVTEVEAVNVPENLNADTRNLSPIALAAEEVSERLDRLIADTPDVMDKANAREMREREMREKQAKQNFAKITDIPDHEDHAGYAKKEQSAGIAEVIANIKAANEGTRDDYRRPANSNMAQTRSPDAYIQQAEKASNHAPAREGFLAYWIAFTAGLCMLLYAASRWFMAPKNITTPVSDLHGFITPVVAIVGALIVLGTLYYLAKTFLRRA